MQFPISLGGAGIMKGITVKAILFLTSFMLIAAFFAPALAIIPTQSGEIPLGVDPGVTLSAHDPIRINNESDLAAMATSGAGTVGDPYGIENYDINASGQGNAIYVGNTTSYLLIQNCSLHHAEHLSSYYYEGAGITAYNAINVMVVNNDCHNNSYFGIYLYSSDNNIISNNTCSGNYYGIWLSSSTNNTMSNNTCGGNSYDIYQYYAGNSIILNNTFEHNS